MHNFTRVILLISFISVIVLGCKDKNDDQKVVTNTVENIYAGYDYVDTVLIQLKSEFEKGLKTNKSREIKELYELHAHGFKWDKLNNVPSSSSYPYNSDFSIEKTNIDLSSTDVLVYNCGYQINRNDTIVDYKHFCLNNKSKYIEFLSNMSNPSDLIKNYITLYKENKAITPDMIDMITLRSEDDLNFADKDHQLFYALHHIVFNEDQKLIRSISQQR